jgi:cyclic lactone autoinducer peptide
MVTLREKIKIFMVMFIGRKAVESAGTKCIRQFHQPVVPKALKK